MPFDLDKLTEFNSALVYSFVPEPSIKALLGSKTYEYRLIPEAAQRQDMLDAYLHAQKVILPQLRKQPGR